MSGPESDEDALFEAYMRTYFPRASVDRERAPTGSESGRETREADHGQPTEEDQFEAYIQRNFPAARRSRG